MQYCFSEIFCNSWGHRVGRVLSFFSSLRNWDSPNPSPAGHRVGRVLSFFSSLRNWDSPNPSPAGDCAPPPPVLGGSTLAGERRVGRFPIPTRGHTLPRTLWGQSSKSSKIVGASQIQSLRNYHSISGQQKENKILKEYSPLFLEGWVGGGGGGWFGQMDIGVGLQ
jgi:hypothetical protein